MPATSPMLHLVCGKIASGKSTLAAELSNSSRAVLISEDEWLKTLFDGEMVTGADYLRFSNRLQSAMAPHVTTLLGIGISVVLDFAANTIEQRSWVRDIISKSSAGHQLHFLDASDEVCLERLHARNTEGKHAFAATEAQFLRFSKYFVAPTPEEGFNIIRH